MTKIVSKKHAGREGSPDRSRSVKNPPKSGSVKSAVVEKAVKKVANRRAGSEHSSSSDFLRAKS